MRFTPNNLFISLCLLSFLFSCESKQITEDPIDPMLTLEKKALDFYNQKKYSKSIETYEDIIVMAQGAPIKYEENLAWAYYEIGFICLVRNQYSKSIEFFKKITENYKNYQAVYTLSKDRIEEIRIRTKGKVI